MKTINKYKLRYLSFCTCLSIIPELSAQNLIQNGSFEIDCGLPRKGSGACEYWEVSPNCIPPWEPAFGTPNVVPNHVPPDGLQCLEMWSQIIDGVTRTEITRYPFLNNEIVRGHKYKLCFYVKNNSVASSEGQFRIILTEDNAVGINSCGDPLPPFSSGSQILATESLTFLTWTRVDITFTALNDFDFLYIVPRAITETQIWTYFDHFVLIDDPCQTNICWTGSSVIPPKIDYRYQDICAGSTTSTQTVAANFNGSISTELRAVESIIFTDNFLADAASNLIGQHYFLAHIEDGGCFECDNYPPHAGETERRLPYPQSQDEENINPPSGVVPNFIVLFATDGREVGKFRVDENQPLNYANLNLARGMYIARYYFNERFIKTEKIMVN